jgi:hypothetical protein
MISEGTTQTVSSVTLPVGHYTLSGSVTFSEDDQDGEQTALSCQYISAATVHQMPIGNFAGAYGVTNPTETMPVIGDANVTTPNTAIFLRCKAVLKDADAEGALIATQVGAVTATS